ncbi:MAG: hypothetical protein ACXAEN_14670 [Candidatus Thorarchaeota archaeon]|jgi:hypothetical protein
MEEKGLDRMRKEVDEFLKKNGFNVFHGRASLLPWGGEVVWNNDDGDWKDFLNVAKEEQASPIILRTDSLDDRQLTELADSISSLEDSGQDFEDAQDFLRGIKSNVGSIGLIQIEWTKGLSTFVYQDQAEWYMKYVQAKELFKEMKSAFSYSVDRHSVEEEIPEGLEKRSSEDLADGIVRLAEKEFGEEFDRSELYMVFQLFWDSIGAGAHYQDASIRMKRRKAENLAMKKLTQAAVAREKEMIPDLSKKCLLWAKKMGLKKVLKSNVEYFLTEEGVTLSTNGRNMIYNEVNLKMKL